MWTLVLIVDDPAPLRTIHLALRQTAGFRVVATIDGRLSARESVARLAPDVVVVDEMCQRSNALARIREVRAELPTAHVVMLARVWDVDFSGHVLEAGADAVLCRLLPPATLGTLLREVVEGSVIHAPRQVSRQRSAHLRVVRTQPVPEARTIA
jgi:DNA-binding NarL/FixJ family response regulator